MSLAVAAAGTDAAGSNFFAATWADSAKRSSSSCRSAPSTNSASRLRLRISLSLNERATRKMLRAGRSRAAARTAARQSSTVAPNFRQACRFTRGSVSVSSQRTICALAKTGAREGRVAVDSCTPHRAAPCPPPRVIQFHCLPRSAIASPSAPVIVMARSATSCSTSSRTNCSSTSNSSLDRRHRSRDDCAAIAFLRRTCSCSAENASSACSASR